MPESTAKAILNEFIETLRTTLNQVTASRLILSGNLSGKPPELDHLYLLFHNNGNPVPLAGPNQLFLSISLQVRVMADPDDRASVPFRVSTDKYLYHVSAGPDDSGKHQELLAYHWDPHLRPPEQPYPHLHVGPNVSSGSQFAPGRFHKLHLPTGRVSLESVLIFLMEEFDVKPLRGRTRPQALALLRESDNQYFKEQTRRQP